MVEEGADAPSSTIFAADPSLSSDNEEAIIRHSLSISMAV
jgi:hypothetical protein